MTEVARPTSLVLLCGVYDPGSPLSLLRGTPHLVRRIWEHTTDYWRQVLVGVQLAHTDHHCSNNSSQVSPAEIRRPW